MNKKRSISTEKLHERLDVLKREAEKGNNQLQQLDKQRTALCETMLRIEGAIQVIQEELEKVDADGEATTEIVSEVKNSSLTEDAAGGT